MMSETRRDFLEVGDPRLKVSSRDTLRFSHTEFRLLDDLAEATLNLHHLRQYDLVKMKYIHSNETLNVPEGGEFNYNLCAFSNVLGGKKEENFGTAHWRDSMIEEHNTNQLCSK